MDFYILSSSGVGNFGTRAMLKPQIQSSLFSLGSCMWPSVLQYNSYNARVAYPWSLALGSVDSSGCAVLLYLPVTSAFTFYYVLFRLREHFIDELIIFPFSY